MSSITLFNKCLGLNDARAFGTQVMKTHPKDPEAGQADLIACSNLTFSDDGCLETVPGVVSVLTHTAPVTGLSAGGRFFFTDGVDTNEWTGGTTVVKRFPLVTGAVCHSPIDVRVSDSSAVYRSKAGTAMEAAAVGTNPGPATSKPFYAMPVFSHAFLYNGIAYAVNATDSRFLQYSSTYGFDLWPLGDNHIGHVSAIMEAGAIPGVMVTTHADGVTVYAGNNMGDFVKRFYPCKPIDKTLFSGYVSKAVGYLHVLLCDDGIYGVLPDATFTRLTDSIDNAAAFNSTYKGVATTERKYLALGNSYMVEYDFKNKGLLLRDALGAAAICSYSGQVYLAIGNNVVRLDDEIGLVTSSMTLPFSDLSAKGIKSFEAFYFTGTMKGELTVTVLDQAGKEWSVVESEELLNVSDYRIKTPRGEMGNHVSVRLDCEGGEFRIEALRAVLSGSKRSK